MVTLALCHVSPASTHSTVTSSSSQRLASPRPLSSRGRAGQEGRTLPFAPHAPQGNVETHAKVECKIVTRGYISFDVLCRLQSLRAFLSVCAFVCVCVFMCVCVVNVCWLEFCVLSLWCLLQALVRSSSSVFYAASVSGSVAAQRRGTGMVFLVVVQRCLSRAAVHARVGAKGTATAP